MRLFTGNFDALEEHLLNFISFGGKAPTDKVLVVLPSQRLQNSLRRGLADAYGCISGVTFCNFTALSAGINFSAEADSKPLLPAGARQDFIIKNILSRYSSLPPSRGYSKAFKAAFRDLISAEVSVKDLLELKTSGEFPSPEQQKNLEEFIVCYNQYQEQMPEDGFETYGDFFKKAALNAADNPYLKSFKYIIFYGFYDFTALQYNLFKEICLNFDASVYFPYEEHPAFGFTKNFFEAYIYPLAKTSEKLQKRQNPPALAAKNIFDSDADLTPDAEMRFISVSGVSAEVQAAAKEVLLLHEKHNIPFNKIAVFARSMENYKYDIPAVFARNKIPVNYSFDFPLVSHPLAAFLYNLLNLGRNDFYSADAAAVLASPYFKDGKSGWRDIIKNSGITGGLSQWDGLADLYVNSKSEEIKENFKKNAGEITAAVKLLSGYYPTLEAAGNFELLAEKATAFIETFTKAELSAQEQNIFNAVKDIISETGGFAKIRKQAALGEFLEEVLSALKEASYNKTESYENAVEAADIMALRGQRVEAAVFIGMNEGLLPAAPAPDPVLKEEYRALLQKIGFLIHTQNERYFEEKLLFALALSSVKGKCSFIFERSGDDGKPKIPSLYLSRLAATVGKNLKEPDLFLSRRESEKLKQWPFELLNRSEVSAYAALNCPGDAQILHIAFNPGNNPNEELKTILARAPYLAFNGGGLNFYDGIVNKNNPLYTKLERKGLSPSSMRLLWLCPCAYLLKNIIRTNDPAEYDRAKIPANAKGTLHHEILQNFYQYIMKHNLLEKLSAESAGEIFDKFADDFLPPERYKEYGLYPLLWKTLCQNIKKNLRGLVEADIPVLQKRNLKPSFFEYHLEAEAEFTGRKIKLYGDTDRIDVNPANKMCRIVDYKTTKESSSMTKAVFEKGVLQPPLYMIMLENSKDETLKGLRPEEAILFAIEENGKREKSLSAGDYEIIKTEFEKAANYRVDLAENGIFIITPSTQACEYCAYADICRKDHAPSLRRARGSAQARKLRSFNASK